MSFYRVWVHVFLPVVCFLISEHVKRLYCTSGGSPELLTMSFRWVQTTELKYKPLHEAGDNAAVYSYLARKGKEHYKQDSESKLRDCLSTNFNMSKSWLIGNIEHFVVTTDFCHLYLENRTGNQYI